MQKRSPIQIALCWMVTTILLAVFVAQSSLSPETYKVEKAYSSYTFSDSQEPVKEVIVTAISLDAVVMTAFNFDFQQYCIDLFVPVIVHWEIDLVVAPYFEIPHFFFSYFYKVFGNLIAANAP